MKLVIDVNILVSAYFWKGTPAIIVDRVVRGVDTLLVSNDIVNEVELVFRKPKFTLYKNLVESAIQDIKNCGKFVEINQEHRISKDDCRDPKDIRYLECALAGNADYIISGDIHLRELREYHGIKIITAREYLDIKG